MTTRSPSAMRIRYLAIPICLVLSFVVATRMRWPGSEGDIPQEVGQQRATWTAHKPSQYVLTVSHTMAVRPDWFTLSKVANGVVENVLCRRYDTGGEISECAVTNALYPVTVEQLFEAVAAAYRKKYHAVDVRYDAQYGYPVYVRFDPVEKIKDDEWGYAIELLDVKSGG